ncbi:RNA polymerase sigma-70 factor [Geomicrobium sp. JCM 19037]|uniref:RNA polymerase sigma factor n=1 Tax=unclassified Geomicrobium TaxID=2628951 RepID=UPI00045F2B7E|nr:MULTISPECIES: sigma-70 family RNA polymerase sigma factor [unclassified Geomicrobium]GAK02183.1 RNA polymerase sigma-70 factor [Geomicrobium sp. JCM 19037]GAK14135.1 RNA polymerase sigma-70 factor [Geomicrobium sp. JCM 19039]
MPKKDVDVYVRLRQGDKDALELMYDRYGKLLYSFSYKMTEDQQFSEEIVQEVFIKIWTQKSSYDETKGKFSSWLLTITRNTVIDHLRKKRETASEIATKEMAEDPDPSVEDQVEWNEKRGVVREAIEQLKPEQQNVIVLFYYRGLSQQKIADQCDIPLGTVKGVSGLP